jgi:hydroxymethylpyrimidine pyrophosphatase-like HAD family hydrolase
MLHLSDWAIQYSDELRPDIRRVVNFVDELDKTEYVWKFVIEGDEVAEFDKLDFVRDHFSGERSWVDRIDYARTGNNKGSALAQYVSSLGLDARQVAAIGDNHNDISMLRYAGLGVAMLNADDIVKQSAQRTTAASNDDVRVLADLIDEIF